jgi:hypothetical protein
MPTAKAYPNGFTMGLGAGQPRAKGDGVKRGNQTGWSDRSTRANTTFLYSVVTSDLSPRGFALSLTLLDMPSSAADFYRVRDTFQKRLRRMEGFAYLHWVLEWQRRGAPHLHMSVFFQAGTDTRAEALVGHWLEAAAVYRPSHAGQHVRTIKDANAWNQYLSKHAVRGAKNYQRQGCPDGWESSGRVWGKSGKWPTIDPVVVESFERGAFYEVRRLRKRLLVAQARQQGDAKRSRWAKSLYRKQAIGPFVGISEWWTEDFALAVVEYAVDVDRWKLARKFRSARDCQGAGIGSN